MAGSSKIIRTTFLTFVSLAALVSLSIFALASGPTPASTPQGQRAYEPKFFRAIIGGHTLHIADGYVNQTMSSIGSRSALIHAYYPGSVPLLRSTDELWQTGKNKNVFGILINDINKHGNFRADFHPHNVLSGHLQIKKADKNVGFEYGLQHFTQSDGKWLHLDDIWVEHDGGLKTSFIACADDAPAPQCQHYFYDDRFFYKVRFNRHFLPKWKAIKRNVLDLVNSFSTEDEARAFIASRIPIAYQTQLERD